MSYKQLLSVCAVSLDVDDQNTISRKMKHLHKDLSIVKDSIIKHPDLYVLHQHEEDLRDYKKELSDVRNDLLSLELKEEDKLNVQLSVLERTMFVHKSISDSDRDAPSNGKGVKLPKLEVPKFDGNIIHWKSFWEQFYISVHDQTNLSDPEKLVYLQHSLKDDSAKDTIKGLSHSGDHYAEPIECLKSRYDRPHLIHQTHVHKILDGPCIKDGTGQELRKLHDTIQQHLRALKAMDYDPSGPFITSVLCFSGKDIHKQLMMCPIIRNFWTF